MTELRPAKPSLPERAVSTIDIVMIEERVLRMRTRTIEARRRMANLDTRTDKDYLGTLALNIGALIAELNKLKNTVEAARE